MKAVTKTYEVYKFQELSGEAKEKVLEDLYAVNVDLEWWESIYEDAERVDLKLTSFDIDRNRYATGDFVSYAIDTARLILKEHSKNCATYETATDFLDTIKDLDEESDNYEDAEDEFLKSILGDYSILLQQEYDYQTSEPAILETIEANDYEFLESGTLF